MKWGCFLWLLLISKIICAQTTGGTSIYSFLSLPSNAQSLALGGVNVSALSDDVSLAVHNPASLSERMHGQVGISFNNGMKGIKDYQAVGALWHERYQTNFAFALRYLSYGVFDQTDAAGNILGEFRPNEYVVQATASRQYSNYIRYGASIKFIHSAYGQYNSSGIALDLALNYHDSSGIQASIVLKNMGVQLKTYAGSDEADLPFDIQLGISKRLSRAPFQFSVTAHQLQRFDISYSDPLFDSVNIVRKKNGFFSKATRHLVVAAQAFPSKNVELTIAYNFLRRSDLQVTGQASGFSGFSFGAGVLLKQLSIRYGLSLYQQGRAFSSFSVNVPLTEFL